jgi:N-acetylglucosaminyldiphosphoundecaprenol N-acetyl-beta-D-mannosaminyltransferase
MAVAVRPRLDSIPLLGIRVDHVTMEQTLRLIDEFVRDDGSHHIVTLDSSMAVMAQTDAELRSIVRDADVVTPDSAGILWAARRVGTDLTDRVSGVDIVARVCERSARTRQRIYFLGAGPGVGQLAAERLGEQYPGCLIVGTQHGYFGEADNAAVVSAIREQHPDILFVALGIPKQEKWIARHRSSLGVPVMIGVGGSLDVHSGRVKRAPAWAQRLSVEWLYRVLQNPRKLGKVMTLPRFALLVLRASRSQAA